MPRFKVPKRLPHYLRPEEVRLVLAALDARWRGLFATAVYLGLRRGEVIALRKSDADLDAGTIRVAHSRDSETTKGGYEDLLPIPDELMPWIARAVEASHSAVLFPREDGEQHAPEVQLQDVLRRALARVEIVNGWIHKCRRKGCGHSERHSHAEPGRCPRCGMRLWPIADQKRLRFHTSGTRRRRCSSRRACRSRPYSGSSGTRIRRTRRRSTGTSTWGTCARA